MRQTPRRKRGVAPPSAAGRSARSGLVVAHAGGVDDVVEPDRDLHRVRVLQQVRNRIQPGEAVVDVPERVIVARGLGVAGGNFREYRAGIARRIPGVATSPHRRQPGLRRMGRFMSRADADFSRVRGVIGSTGATQRLLCGLEPLGRRRQALGELAHHVQRHVRVSDRSLRNTGAAILSTRT